MSYWGKKKNKKTKPSKEDPITQPTQTAYFDEDDFSLKKGYAANDPIEFASEVNLNENESEFITFIMQTSALLWKNYILFTRKQRIVFFILITPPFVAALLDAIIKITSILHMSDVIEQPIQPVE